MFSDFNLDREGNATFKRDCMLKGMSEKLVNNALGVFTHSVREVFVFDVSYSDAPYYVINESGVVLQCGGDNLHNIIKHAINLVVEEVEYELKRNTVLSTNEDIESTSALKYCGNVLKSMLEDYMLYIESKLSKDEVNAFKKEAFYYNNLVTIALTDYTK